MSDLDALTGLPALPDDQFWRIEPSSATSGWLTLALMQRTSSPGFAFYEYRWKRLHRTKVAVPYLPARNGSVPLAAGLFNLSFAADDHVATARRILAERELIGDYPPKKLPDARESGDAA
jgi:hypothetical protein